MLPHEMVRILMEENAERRQRWAYLTEDIKRADQRSKTIIEFLKKEDNKALQELAAVPMLLQIMAIIWKDRKHLPKSRPALFDAALNYLLAYRDEEKEIEPLLPAEESRRVKKIGSGKLFPYPKKWNHRLH